MNNPSCAFCDNLFLFFQMTLLLRMDDQMNRQLTCEFTSEDTPKSLADELVGFGFINAVCITIIVTANTSMY